MMQPMPTGAYVRWPAVDEEGTMLQAQPPHHSNAAHKWLEWTVHQLGRPLQHKGNSHKKRLRICSLPVDRWDAVDKKAYQFHSCHLCSSLKMPLKRDDPATGSEGMQGHAKKKTETKTN